MPAAELSAAEKRLREEDQRIEAALQKTVPDVRFESLPFGQVLQFFAEVSQANIHTDWQGFADAGIERDKPITINLRNLPLERVLRVVLDTAGGYVRLGYEVRDGVLLIATQEQLDQDLITRVYPVRDLLVAMALKLQREQTVAKSAPAAGILASELAKATDAEYREQLAKRSMTATQPTSVPTAEVDEAFVAQAEQELQELLRLTVLPDSWRENGGYGTARIYNGALAVRQWRRAQREVERFLADLRAAGAAERGPGQPVIPK
jgi:hypothetical protein